MAAAKLMVSRRRPETSALDPHLHTLALDGVFAEDDAGELTFPPLSCLTNDDVADVLQIARAPPPRPDHAARRT